MAQCYCGLVTIAFQYFIYFVFSWPLRVHPRLQHYFFAVPDWICAAGIYPLRSTLECCLDSCASWWPCISHVRTWPCPQYRVYSPRRVCNYDLCPSACASLLTTAFLLELPSLALSLPKFTCDTTKSCYPWTSRWRQFSWSVPVAVTSRPVRCIELSSEVNLWRLHRWFGQNPGANWLRNQYLNY